MRFTKIFSPQRVILLLIISYCLGVYVTYLLDKDGKLINHSLAIATFFAVIVALYKDIYINWYYRGNAQLEFLFNDSYMEEWKSDAFVFRCSIYNNGTSAIENVEMYVKNILVEKGYLFKGAFRPGYISWPNRKERTERIPSKDIRFFNLLSVDGKAVSECPKHYNTTEHMCLYTINVNEFEVSVCPGVYKVYASISADNMATKDGYFLLSLPKRWSNNVDGWRATGLRIEWHDA